MAGEQQESVEQKATSLGEICRLIEQHMDTANDKETILA